MKVELFVNSVFFGKDGNPEAVAARLRGVRDGKSFKLPASCFSTMPEKHDGLLVKLGGEVAISGNYVVPADAKVLQIVAGAGTPTSQKMSAEEYLASLQQVPAHSDEDALF